VLADGTVRVTVPRRGSEREAARFAEQHRDWIARQLQRSPAQPVPLDPALERQFRQQARQELPRRTLELAAHHNVPVQRVTVRN
jgi:predicted metal-dependent hydrolase